MASVVAGLAHGDPAAGATAVRRRKSAAERRAQRARAQARAVSHLLAGFEEVAAHRGNAVSRTATTFSWALRCLSAGGWTLHEKSGARAGEGPTTASSSAASAFSGVAERTTRVGRMGIVCKEATSGAVPSSAAYGSFVASGVGGANEGASSPSLAPAVVDAQKLAEVIQVPLVTRSSGDDMASVPVVGLLGGFKDVGNMAAESGASSTSAAAASSSALSRRVSFKDEGWPVGMHISLDGKAEEASRAVSTGAVVSVQEVGQQGTVQAHWLHTWSMGSKNSSAPAGASVPSASSCAVSAVSTCAAVAAASPPPSARRRIRQKQAKGQSSEQATACSTAARVALIQRAVMTARASGRFFPFGMKGVDFDKEAGDRDDFPFGFKGVDYDKEPGDLG
jgi:hypothetical protein